MGVGVSLLVGAVTGVIAGVVAAHGATRALARQLADMARQEHETRVAVERLTEVVASAPPADQAWYWTPEWQAGEREADEDIAVGRVTRFESDEAMDAFLDAIPTPDAQPVYG